MKDILVEGKESYRETKKYMSQLLPSCAKFVKQYKSKEPIFSKYKVENEIIKMFNKNNAISFSFNPKEKYTLWTGLLGGFFLSLSYFGTDQSQVSRYINAKDQKESRTGLIFNAILKIPFQFLILYIGILLFVFYNFYQPPVNFNDSLIDYQSKNKIEILQGFVLDKFFCFRFLLTQ